MMGVRMEGIGGYYSICWRPGETEPNSVECFRLKVCAYRGSLL